ncbi:MAG: alpha/beta hydrolase [Chromatiaceae bacterium]|nr:alpha/beta hydrolase [Chromatiaceae bacterium]
MSDVSYTERAMGTLTGRLFLAPTPGPNPAVLLLHGGGWRNGSPQQMDVIARRLVSEGFVVFSAEYRLAPGTRYPGQLEDARAAFAWLVDRQEVDPGRVAAWGYSAGAQLALLLGLNPSPGQPRPRAVVAGGTPAALCLFDAESRLLVNYLGAPRTEVPETWADASPVEWVSKDDPPTYLCHGQADRLVDIRHARLLASRMLAAGVAVTLDEVPGGHIAVFLAGRAVEGRATAFLARQLGG